MRERLLAAAQNGTDNPTEAPAGDRARIREAALDASANAQLVIDSSGGLAFANHHARRLFGLSAGGDKKVRLWDLSAGRQVAELAGHSGPVHCLRFGPGGTAVVRDLTEGQILREGARRDVLDCARQDGEECTAGGMGPASAAIEIDRHAHGFGCR